MQKNESRNRKKSFAKSYEFRSRERFSYVQKLPHLSYALIVHTTGPHIRMSVILGLQ